MSNINYLKEVIDKIELSHQAISKTVSDFGGDLLEVKRDVNQLKTALAVVNNKIDGFIETSRKHEDEISLLKKSDTEIRSTFTTAKVTITAATAIVFGLIGTITVLGNYIYQNDVETLNAKIEKTEATNNKILNEVLVSLEKYRLNK